MKNVNGTIGAGWVKCFAEHTFFSLWYCLCTVTGTKVNQGKVSLQLYNLNRLLAKVSRIGLSYFIARINIFNLNIHCNVYLL